MRAGRSIFEGLEFALNSYDLGIAVFGPKDNYRIGRADGHIPLCNVALEFGLFAGRHGRKRSIAIHGAGGIPGMSDTQGILGVLYTSQRPSSIAEEVAPKILECIMGCRAESTSSKVRKAR